MRLEKLLACMIVERSWNVCQPDLNALQIGSVCNVADELGIQQQLRDMVLEPGLISTSALLSGIMLIWQLSCIPSDSS